MHIELLMHIFGYKIQFSYYGVKFFYALINLSCIKYTLSYIIYKNNYDAVLKNTLTYWYFKI